jgi:ribosome-associated protein
MVDAQELAQHAAEAADGKKAVDILILDLRGLTVIADFFVICSGTSTTQVSAIADGVGMALRRIGHHPSHIEGSSEATWVLMDYGDVVVHVFEERTRAYYAIERLWGDAPRVPAAFGTKALQGASS